MRSRSITSAQRRFASFRSLAAVRYAAASVTADAVYQNQDILASYRADYVVVLEFGNKIAEGVPEEIRANPKVRAAYLGNPD